jgi:hypothetical protein
MKMLVVFVVLSVVRGDVMLLLVCIGGGVSLCAV